MLKGEKEVERKNIILALASYIVTLPGGHVADCISVVGLCQLPAFNIGCLLTADAGELLTSFPSYLCHKIRIFEINGLKILRNISARITYFYTVEVYVFFYLILLILLYIILFFFLSLYIYHYISVYFFFFSYCLC